MTWIKRGFFRIPSIRAKILLWFLLPILLLIAISGISLHHWYSDFTMQNIQNSAIALAESKAAEIGQWLLARLGEIHAVSERHVARSLSNMSDELRFFRNERISVYETGFLANTFGDTVARTDGTSSVNLSDRDYYDEIIKQGRPYSIANPRISVGSGNLVVPIVVAVKDLHGETIGMIGFTVLLTTLTDIASEIHFQKSGFGWIVDGTGTVIAHPDETVRMNLNLLQAEAFGYTGLDTAGRKMLMGESGQFERIIQPSGKATLIFYEPIPFSPKWTLGITLSEEELFADLYRLSWFLAAFFLVIVGIVILFSIWAGVFISKPIQTLSDVVGRFGEIVPKELPEKMERTMVLDSFRERLTPNSSDEIGNLAKAFNLMAQSIETSMIRITSDAQKIDAYNQELEATNQELKANNEELENAYLEIGKLAGGLESIFKLTFILTKRALEDDALFFHELLTTMIHAIEPAQTGTIATISEDEYRVCVTTNSVMKTLVGHTLTLRNKTPIEQPQIIYAHDDWPFHIHPEKKERRGEDMGVSSSLVSSILLGKKPLGIIILDIPDHSEDQYTPESVRMLRSFTNLAASYITIRDYIASHEQFQKQIVLSMIKILEIHDPYTRGHSEQVAKWVSEMAKEMKMAPEEASRAYWAGLVHDIGKILVPERILIKSSSLDPEEWDTIQNHPRWGAEVLATSDILKDISLFVLHHHETWDGKGYPDHLMKEEIPIVSRMIAIADSFDAMTSDRPYRKGLSDQEAVREIQTHAGTQFDPEMVEIFLRCLMNTPRFRGTNFGIDR